MSMLLNPNHGLGEKETVPKAENLLLPLNPVLLDSRNLPPVIYPNHPTSPFL